MVQTLWMISGVALAQAESTGTPAQGPSGGMPSMLIMLVAFLAIMYFLMIRPNQKRDRERREMLAALSKGDRVVTSGGLLGAVVGLTEKNVVLRISDDPVVKVECLRSSVARVLSKEEQS